jgi:hypothetical protein
MEPAPTAILDDRRFVFPVSSHTTVPPAAKETMSPSPTRLNPGHNKPRIKGILRSPPKNRGGPAPTESTLVADDTPGLSQKPLAAKSLILIRITITIPKKKEIMNRIVDGTSSIRTHTPVRTMSDLTRYLTKRL